MLKKTITYVDYNDNKITEDFYFNLSKSELAEMEMSKAGGFADLLKKVINTQDMPALAKIFKEFILKAYGEKSDDGRRFIKSPELSKAFSETPAYDELYVELMSDEDKAAEFFMAIIPSEYSNSKEFKEQLEIKKAELKSGK